MALEQTEVAVESGQRRGSASRRSLTWKEIEARMRQVIDEVAAVRTDESDAARRAAAEGRPRWIEPAELVRRLERFITPN